MTWATAFRDVGLASVPAAIASAVAYFGGRSSLRAELTASTGNIQRQIEAAERAERRRDISRRLDQSRTVFVDYLASNQAMAHSAGAQDVNALRAARQEMDNARARLNLLGVALRTSQAATALGNAWSHITKEALAQTEEGQFIEGRALGEAFAASARSVFECERDLTGAFLEELVFVDPEALDQAPDGSSDSSGNVPDG